MIGRQTQVVDCRESMGLAKGGGLAQRGTLSEAARPDVIAIAMSPGRRHITKPVCEITYGLRREGIQTSVLVLEAGTGVPDSFPQASRGYGPTFGLTPKEIEQIQRHKIAVIHLGNVKSHVIYKTRDILAYVDIPAVVVSQCPVDFEDFAKEGVKTRVVMPPKSKQATMGTVVDIVTGVTRGATCGRSKLNTLAKVLNKHLAEMESKRSE
ncbi:MAG: methyl-coenzyme M reductase I operon protein C [Methanothrix sp.]|jgi:methyl-coenzyme M reductase subunit C|uniref:Methyl-coenzyme M reductase operon protein C n=1 Tax=Methanothrix thermoacetophila (strain DSM 6194 / JCM 14653 / NBRC 101360 / PT) TaxID=349307 RepID=A0B6L3_METTP|nr:MULTISPECIES: methyl-coenzyme M reductase I operon protein C [Methanothrix]ABK14337.1 Methyl-coenzyme M reductase operon protein C [Methanothrix thermoacetophila PT]MBC7080329.1 methyl-coenzyme M reductase I operon protein C [Methanothrix sp.]NPU87638.1 methyl-coenzyme M reductase I operon protein C [Methanothrix sp.]